MTGKLSNVPSCRQPTFILFYSAQGYGRVKSWRQTIISRNGLGAEEPSDKTEDDDATETMWTKKRTRHGGIGELFEHCSTLCNTHNNILLDGSRFISTQPFSREREDA